ncbi:MAG: phage/plasmid primase, P4 family [Balneolales bacterium]
METKTIADGLPDGYAFDDVNAVIEGETKHEKLLDQLLKSVGEIDFREVAGLGDDDKLTSRHFIVYTVKEILRLASELNWDICQHNGFIYLYNGCYWKRIPDDSLKRFLGEASKRMGWDESFADHFLQRDHLYKQFKSEAYLPAPDRDPDKVLINLLNGTFEITSNGTRLRDFDPADFLTYQLPFEYDPNATAPKFEKFLSEVLPDQSLRDVLSEYTGYLFVPSPALKLEKVMMLHGPGANGKSVYFDILQALVGKENFSTYSLQSLTNDNGYYRADLGDRLVNYASEISGRVETSYFKTLASGEPIEARLPYREPVVITDYARLIFNVNQLPYDVEHTEGFFRRFIIVPFNVTIPKEKRDIELAQKIISDELPGIFNWALRGLNKLLKNKNFTHSDKIEAEIQSYRTESDSVALYMDENGYKTSLESYRPQKELYTQYRIYALDNGYKPVSNITFGKRLDNIGFMREAKAVGQVVYTQIQQ